MDKIQLEFFNREKNVMPLSGMRAIRQETFNNVDHILIKMGDIIVFEIFQKINKDKVKKNIENAEKKTNAVEQDDHVEEKKPPKHTGGKPSYIKVMSDYLNKNDVSIDCIGLLVKLSLKNITWGTGQLIKGRGKNRKPLIIDDICKIIHKSKTYVSETIKELKTAGIIEQNKDGYKISPNVIQKGGVIK